jgi:UDP-GlcNAc:undecaprenyl-phosphate GlcNAc-1-phosphate transferase
VALPVAVPPDAGLAASILLLVLAVTAALVPRTVPLLVRTGLYVGSTFLLYFIEIDSVPAPHPWLHPLNLFLAGLALLVFLVMRLHAVRQFETTPLDSLMVLLALLLPFLPELHIGDVNLSLLTAKLIVLFFSFELSLYAYADRISYAGFLVLWLLGGFAVRAWW